MPSGLDKYERIRKLGQGSFGSVFLVRDIADKKQYVLKEINLTAMGPQGRTDALKEVSFMTSLNHPSIISYKEFFEEVPTEAVWKNPQKKLYIVMEYADAGDLSKSIAQRAARRDPFPEEMIIDWVVQICLALKHMHDRKIIHRDIKSENVFLTGNNTVKLGDFGISKNLAHTMANAMTRIGTPYYLSPEICLNKPYNTKTDMWGLGVVLYELMNLRHPFDAPSMEKLLQKIVSAQYSPMTGKQYTKSLTKVVEMLLQKNPKSRPDVHDLLKMPVFAARVPQFLTNQIIDDEFSHTIIHSSPGGLNGPKGNNGKPTAARAAAALAAINEASGKRKALSESDPSRAQTPVLEFPAVVGPPPASAPVPGKAAARPVGVAAYLPQAAQPSAVMRQQQQQLSRYQQQMRELEAAQQQQELKRQAERQAYYQKQQAQDAAAARQQPPPFTPYSAGAAAGGDNSRQYVSPRDVAGKMRALEGSFVRDVLNAPSSASMSVAKVPLASAHAQPHAIQPTDSVAAAYAAYVSNFDRGPSEQMRINRARRVSNAAEDVSRPLAVARNERARAAQARYGDPSPAKRPVIAPLSRQASSHNNPFGHVDPSQRERERYGAARYGGYGSGVAVQAAALSPLLSAHSAHPSHHHGGGAQGGHQGGGGGGGGAGGGRYPAAHDAAARMAAFAQMQANQLRRQH